MKPASGIVGPLDPETLRASRADELASESTDANHADGMHADDMYDDGKHDGGKHDDGKHDDGGFSGGGRYSAGNRNDAGSDSLWWRYGFVATLAVLVLLIPVLVYAGVRVVLSSNSGKLIQHVSDPAAPGWQAVAEPTPTHVIASLDEDGDLAGVTFFAQTGDDTAGIVQIPSSTMFGAGGSREVTLNEEYRRNGVDGLGKSLEGILGIGVSDIELVESGEWASLLGPIGSLKVSNPDPVVTENAAGEQQIVFPKGSIDLKPTEVWDYLSLRGPEESELNLLVRREAFWRAWIGAVASGAGESPGIAILSDIADDQIVFETLPVTASTDDIDGAEVYAPITDEVRSLISQVVPFPVGPAGIRIRLEVFDGTGQLDHGVGVAVLLGAAGGQVDRIGNAASFDVATTQFVYFDESKRSQVEDLRDALGFGEVIQSEEATVTVDATVILGADALAGMQGTIGTDGD